MALKDVIISTTLGAIPSEWEVTTLKGVSTKITDGDHATPRRQQSGYYLLSARNVLNGRIDATDVDFVGHDEYSRMRQRCAPETGDVLISCSGTIGRIAVVPQNFACVLVRSAALVKVNGKGADGVFLQYWLQGEKAQRQISASVNQGAQPNLFINQIERILCPKPSLTEQRAIGEALWDVDELIGSLERLIAKKRDIKQAVMQQLLTGKTRLPGYSKEWRHVKLGSLGQFLKGSGISRSQAQSGSIPCVRYGELYTSHHNVILTFESFISREAAITALRLKKGDILFAGSGETKEEIGKCAAFVNDLEAYAGGDIVVLRSQFECARYLGYYLNTSVIANQKASKGQGDAVVHISAKALANIDCHIPEVHEQEAIAEVITSIDLEIAHLNKRIAKTRDIKQGMMQQLLTGKVRLV